MKILLVGQGGRESALAWALSKSRDVERIFVAPGNGGTLLVGENIPIGVTEFEKLVTVARDKQVDLVVVGPEVPLSQGISDVMRRKNIAVFGPSMQAARIESSKIFCKELLSRYQIPQAGFRVFDSAADAHAYIDTCPLPIVLKADGLCQGKGVIVAKTRDEAHQGIRVLMEEKFFGEAGGRIVIEEFLNGRECSLMVISDGEHIVPLMAARDYKRAYDGDHGPNTGGMGCYAPVPDFSSELQTYCLENLIYPTVRAMAGEGYPFIGTLYAGLMLTKEGPKVLEYNCRFADPETQVILPLLESDLAELLMAAAAGSLQDVRARWSNKSAVCVVLAAGGYPGEYAKDDAIEGIEEAVQNPNVFVFHAGTALKNGTVVTNGGRVLNVVALGRNHREARIAAYSAAAKISFKGMQYRKDIAQGE